MDNIVEETSDQYLKSDEHINAFIAQLSADGFLGPIDPDPSVFPEVTPKGLAAIVTITPFLPQVVKKALALSIAYGGAN